MATCKSCEAEIVWAETAAGKNMPLDAAPSTTGEWVLINGHTRKANDDDRKLRRPTYTPHWSKCPDAPQFRGRK